MAKRKLKVLDSFAGAGGFSLGFELTGNYEVIGAIEYDQWAADTFQYNHKNAKVLVGDIQSYSDDDLLNAFPEKPDIVLGGPPCQGFSTAGRRIENDTRNRLIESYIKFIRLVQPRVIFFENVKGFTQKFDKNKVKGRVYSEYVQNALKRGSKRLNATGYNVYGKLIDFSEFGVPQKRTRFILVGIRKDVSDTINPKLFFEQIKKNKKELAASIKYYSISF